jgi:hypothetical protein
MRDESYLKFKNEAVMHAWNGNNFYDNDTKVRDDDEVPWECVFKLLTVWVSRSKVALLTD